MAPTMDPEVETALAPMIAAMSSMPKLAIGDIDGRRQAFASFLEALFGSLPQAADVDTKDYHITTSDGHELLLRWIFKTSPKPATPTSAVVYAHGGGMIMADVNIYTPLLKGQVSQSGVPVLAVDFRPAPEHRGPTMAEDCLAALQWLHSQTSTLHIDPTRIAIMGDSGGGGVAAATAILARDQHLSPPLAKQILIYPMLDDRTIHPDPTLGPFVVWSHEDNLTAWSAVTGRSTDEMMSTANHGGSSSGGGGGGGGGGHDTDKVSPYTAPGRLTDASGLPPAFIDVGALDLFRGEDVEYARKLSVANVSTELHVRAGCPHGWEGLAPNAAVTKRAMADRLRAVLSF